MQFRSITFAKLNNIDRELKDRLRKDSAVFINKHFTAEALIDRIESLLDHMQEKLGSGSILGPS